MSTTSLKLPTDVKQLAITAAKRQGISPHAFMVSAIRAAATNAEKRAQFVAGAVTARADAIECGEGYAAEDVHAYLRAKVHGQSVDKPKAKVWR